MSVMQIGEGTRARRHISGLRYYGSRRCTRCSQSIAAERVDQLSRGLDWFMHMDSGTASAIRFCSPHSQSGIPLMTCRIS